MGATRTPADASAHFGRALKSGHAEPLVARYWVEGVSRGWPLFTWLRLRRLPEPARMNVRAHLLQHWSQKAVPRFVPRLALFQRQALLSSTVRWASMRAALLSSGLTGAARRWLRDWRERAALSRWMLLNVIAALLKKDPDTARQAMQRGLALPDDGSESTIMSWALWFEALDGHAEGYRATLTRAEPPPQSERFDWMLRALAGAVAVARGLVEPPPGKTRFDEVERLYHAARTLHESRSPGLPHYRTLRNQMLWRVRKVDGWRSLYWVIVQF